MILPGFQGPHPPKAADGNGVHTSLCATCRHALGSEWSLSTALPVAKSIQVDFPLTLKASICEDVSN